MSATTTSVITQTLYGAGQQDGSGVPYSAPTGQVTGQVSLTDTDASNSANKVSLSLIGSFDGGKSYSVIAGPADWQGGTHAIGSTTAWALPTLVTSFGSGQTAPTHVSVRVDSPQPLSYGGSVTQA